jgi:hypothetical protein
MGEYVRQHWIPDTYLDAWCDPDPARQNPQRVYRYGIDGRYRDYRPPSRIFTVDDLYTVPESNGGRDLKTEHALNRLEDAFARMRANYLMRSVPLPPPARRDLLWFIAALRNRSPAMHAHHTAFNDRILKVATSMEDGLKAMSPEKRAEWHEKTRRMSSGSADDKGIPLNAFREIAAQPFGAYLPVHVVTEAQLLEQMHLVILRIPDEHPLITSDRPVVWWDPNDPPQSRTPLGLGRRTIEITVPLTPFLCAQISHRRGPDYADTDVEGVDILNLRTLNRAREMFIAHSPDLVVDWQDEQGGG